MIAVTMARNEADIIGRTVAHLYSQGVDKVIVADNLSTDLTAQIAKDAGAWVTPDPDRAYYQGAKMTALAARFAKCDEWVVPFDADEFWWGVDKLNDDTPYDIVTAQPHVHVRDERRMFTTEPQPKVAFRWRKGAQIQMGNHWVDCVGERIGFGVLEVCHHQYRSLEQVAHKVRQGVAAYDLTMFGEVHGSHWRELAALDDEVLAEWWATYINQATVRCHLLPQ